MRYLPLSAVLSALLACPAWAAKWEVVPTLSVGEIYTDNLSLSPDTSRQSAWVTQVVPGISLSAVGAASRFNLSYTPALIYYAEGVAENKTYHQLSAFANAELVNQLLFVDAGASVGPQSISLLAPLSLSSFNTTGNLATVVTYYVSPYLRRDFGSAVQAEARFAYTVANTEDASALPDSVANRISLRLNSGPAYKLLVWAIDYTKELIDYTTQQDIETEVFAAKARRLITPAVGLLAHGGYDYYKTGVGEPASEGPSWGVGLDWAPTPRTHLAATIGQRFYGDDYFLDFKHRTRLTAWSAGYSQAVTTTRSLFSVPVTESTAGYLDTLFISQFPDPAARKKAVEDFIARTGLPPTLSEPVNFFSSQLFLEKRSQASAGIMGVRNVLVANVFNLTRDQLVGDQVLPGTGDFVSGNTVIQTGMGLLWSLRMTSQNIWNLRAGYSRDKFPGTGQINERLFVVTGLNRQFQPRFSGALDYRLQQNDSNFVGSAYRENALFATMQMRF